MAIFGSKTEKQVETEIDVNLYPSIRPTMESCDAILLEATEDLYKIRAGLYVADVLIEEKICTEGYSEDIDVVAEATVKEAYDKVVKVFKDLWAKIQVWFKKVIDFFNVMKKAQEKFLKDNDKAIKEKAADANAMKGFSYPGYKFNPEALNTICKKAETIIKGEIDRANSIDFDKTESVENLKIAKDVAEYEEHICGLISGGKNVSDVKNAVLAAGKGDKKDPSDPELTLNDISVDAMIKFCSDTGISAVKESQKAIDADLKKVIAKFEKEAKKGKKDESATKGVTKVAPNYKKLIAINTGINSIRVDILKETNNQYMRALRKILNYKPAPAKESVGSILESAMSLLG